VDATTLQEEMYGPLAAALQARREHGPHAACGRFHSQGCVVCTPSTGTNPVAGWR